MHELCPIRGREAEVALSLDTPFAELLPGVVIEFDCGATAALAKRRRQTPQAAEASASAFSRSASKMAESAPAGAIDATIHALDVVFWPSRSGSMKASLAPQTGQSPVAMGSGGSDTDANATHSPGMMSGCEGITQEAGPFARIKVRGRPRMRTSRAWARQPDA